MMQRFLLAISAVVLLSGVNAILAPKATAAGVNCSYAACIKECQRRGANGNGCNYWCNNAMKERKDAGQCK
jgi:hypothetical protein